MGIVEDWGLEVGSKVAWSGGYSSTAEAIGVVEKITPSGLVDVAGEFGWLETIVRFKQNGREHGANGKPRKLYQLTPKVEAQIERDRLIAEFSRVAEKAGRFPNEYTTEQIKVLLNLLCRPEKWNEPDRTAQIETAFYSSADF